MKVLLITPPFTQLNTPYPATTYLKGFLDHQGIDSDQCDLSIELFISIFTQPFIDQLFNSIDLTTDTPFKEVWDQREEYILKVEKVISYLQHQEVTLAHQIVRNGFLPKSHRAEELEENLDWAFGNLGILDKAKLFATVFIEELGDFIRGNIDEFFSFTRYAEQIASSASSFNQLATYLQYEPTLIEKQLNLLLDLKISDLKPTLICFTVPFPGNLFATLRCGQFIKKKYPHIKIAMGGGYCNTELRSLTDSRIFDYVDFITLDKGERPLLNLIHYLEGKTDKTELVRTYLREGDKVVYQNKLPNKDFTHNDLPAPSYKGLSQQTYLSFLDVMNPMHRLWSDGKWNKLTISHGCYWKKCSFCDVGLDYIGNYENTTAKSLVDKIEKMIEETNITGFHFVDEAAPPKMLEALANELIKRKVHITWWTNIRFEKTFTPQLCELLAASGCIAVTGGLEVASDRLLTKMEKGVDIGQVANVTNAFSQNNIMVHAYLMYGFPTQTDQETIDSLEIVRQLFLNGCIYSAFWHKFTTTVHSPIGKAPEKYEIEITGPVFEGFAQNDLWHEDPQGGDHDQFTEGLNFALQNYLNGLGLDAPLDDWFDFEIPQTSHSPDYINDFLE